MKTQCPKCKFIFDVPPEYIGKKIKCRRCEKDFMPEKFKKPPIVIPSLPSRRNFLTKLWSKSPNAFKTGFLATLGVLSAFLLFLKFSPSFFPRQSAESFNFIRSQLESKKLFLVNTYPQAGYLRGRALSYYEFKRDATRYHSLLCIWINDRNIPVAITADWLGNFFGSPADITNDAMEHTCSSAVVEGFKHIIGCEPFSIYYKEEEFTNGQMARVYRKNKWQLEVIRSDAFSYINPTKHHESFARFEATINDFDPNKIDLGVFSFSAIAKTW